MNTGFELSENELTNLRDGLDRMEQALKADPLLWEQFYDDPFRFIRGFDIEITKHLEYQMEVVEDFNKSLRKLMRGLRIFNKCVACKVAALLLLYGLTGGVGFAYDGGIKTIEGIIGFLDKIFRKTSKDADSFLDWLIDKLDKMTFAELALSLCRFHGHCKE